MGTHVFQSICGEVRRDLLRARGSLWLQQFRFKVFGHQYLNSVGLPDDDRKPPPYDRGIVGVYVAPHNMPLLTSCCYLESENVWAMEE